MLLHFGFAFGQQDGVKGREDGLQGLLPRSAAVFAPIPDRRSQALVRIFRLTLTDLDLRSRGRLWLRATNQSYTVVQCEGCTLNLLIA